MKTNRDRRNWWQSPWLRRGLLLSPALLLVLGLANFFGQRPSTARAESADALLSVDAPTRARSGLIYAARFRVDALHQLKKAALVLDQGWADGYTVNGQAPQPVNPTTVGRHAQTVRLYDGSRLITTVRRSVFIFP